MNARTRQAMLALAILGMVARGAGQAKAGPVRDLSYVPVPLGSPDPTLLASLGLGGHADPSGAVLASFDTGTGLPGDRSYVRVGTVPGNGVEYAEPSDRYLLDPIVLYQTPTTNGFTIGQLQYYTPDYWYPFLEKSGVLTQILTFVPAAGSPPILRDLTARDHPKSIIDINDDGVGVGTWTYNISPSSSVPLQRAIIADMTGVAYDLNGLLVSATETPLDRAVAINDRGDILAFAGTQEYLLMPAPEPTTVIPAATAGLIGLGCAWRRMAKPAS